MGIWDAISSTSDSLKNWLPDPEPVKDAGKSAYSVVVSKLNSVDEAVRVKGVQQVRESMPDKELLQRIGWNLTDNALDNYSRPFTGGLPVYSTIKEVLLKRDAKTSKTTTEQELEEMRSRMERLETMLSAKNSHDEGVHLRRSPQ